MSRRGLGHKPNEATWQLGSWKQREARAWARDKVAQELEKQEDQREKKSGPCSSFTIDFECCIYVGQADSRDVRGTEINYGQRTKESPREGKCFREPEGNSE